MKNRINLKPLSLFTLLFIPLASLSQANDVKKLYSLFEDKKRDYFKKNTEQKLIVLEQALDTTKKWNLKHYMKDNFNAF